MKIRDLSPSTKRISNFELLRIVAMFMVVISHVSFHGIDQTVGYNNVPSLFNRYLLKVVGMGSLGVDIFIMISGYFLISKSKINIERLIKLIFQVFTYSLIIYSLLLTFNVVKFNIIDGVRAFCPTISGMYWFFTTYVVLYMFSPFLNIILNSNRQNRLSFIVIMSILWCLIPSFTTFLMCSSDFVLFVLLYSLGATIKLDDEIKLLKLAPTKKILYTLIFIWFFIALIALLLYPYLPFIFNHVGYFYSKSSLIVILLSYSIVSYTSKAKPFYNKYINIISSTAFGIYLLSDNAFAWDYQYAEILNCDSLVQNKYIMLYVIAYSVLIFTLGVIIEKIRAYIMHILSSPINRLSNKVSELFESVINRF